MVSKSKKHLTRQEEFDILKLILDKFLWLGVGIMAYGFFLVLNPIQYNIGLGLLVMLGGAVLLIIFMNLLMRQYYFLKE